jgi:hypothetical protein
MSAVHFNRTSSIFLNCTKWVYFLVRTGTSVSSLLILLACFLVLSSRNIFVLLVGKCHIKGDAMSMWGGLSQPITATVGWPLEHALSSILHALYQTTSSIHSFKWRNLGQLQNTYMLFLLTDPIRFLWESHFMSSLDLIRVLYCE